MSVTAQPTAGVLTGPDNTGAFTYAPRANYYGSDSFAISVVDNQGLSASATIALSITSVNDVPSAISERAMTAPSSPVTISVLANDSDVESQSLQPQIATQSPNGVTEVQSDGSVIFTPASGFAGVTRFEYRAVDSEGGASQPVAVDIDVRPMKSAVYYTAAGTDPQVVLTSPSSTRRLSPVLSSGSEIQELQVSANRRTAAWQVRPAASYNDAWFYIDLTADDASAGTLGGTYFDTQVVLSPVGTHALVPEPVQVGFNMSNIVRLQPLFSGGTQTIHSTPATDQLSYYGFSPDGQSVIYRTNAPTQLDTAVAYYRVSIDATQSPTPLVQPLAATEQGGYNVKVTPDGNRVLFDGYVNNWSYPVLRSTRMDGSTNAQIVGPQLTDPSFQIPDFEIAATSRYAAFTNRTGTTPPQHAVSSFVIDLEAGVHARIGNGFTTSHRVTQPTFNRDGTKVALGISSAGETAIYEASVSNASVLTRVGSLHESRVIIGQVRYATGDRVVYTADVRQSGVHELFIARDGQSQRLNTDLGTSVSVNSSALGFTLSSDGTTVAYAQPPTPAGPRDLYLIDVTTPGLPLRIGENVSAELFQDLAYSILD